MPLTKEHIALLRGDPAILHMNSADLLDSHEELREEVERLTTLVGVLFDNTREAYWEGRSDEQCRQWHDHESGGEESTWDNSGARRTSLALGWVEPIRCKSCDAVEGGQHRFSCSVGRTQLALAAVMRDGKYHITLPTGDPDAPAE